VGSFKMNVLGFYDLGGNASEWMWDGLDEKAARRVIRGGSWVNGDTGHCSVANRSLINLEFRGNDYGFRVALNSVP